MTEIRKFTPAPGAVGNRELVRGPGTAERPVSRKPTGKRKLPDYLIQSQVDVLLKQTAELLPQAYLPMLIQWRAGLRISEACSLAWADVDLEAGQLFVRDAKTGDRNVPIQDQLRDELDAIRRYRIRGPQLIRLTPRRIAQCYASVIRRSVSLWPVDVPEISSKRITTHTFRRSAAIHWHRHGAMASQIQKWLGHRHLTTTQIYLELESDYEGIMERIP